MPVNAYKKLHLTVGFMLPDPLYKFYYERIDIMKKLFTLLLTLALINKIKNYVSIR